MCDYKYVDKCLSKEEMEEQIKVMLDEINHIIDDYDSFITKAKYQYVSNYDTELFANSMHEAKSVLALIEARVHCRIVS